MTRSSFAPTLCAAALFAVGAAHATPTVVNSGFELPVLGAATYAYHQDNTSGPSADLSGSGWRYVGNTGIAAESNTQFAIGDASGQQVVFLQGTKGEPYSVIRQTVNGFDAGVSYTLSFLARMWLDFGPNPLVVSIDDVALTFSGSTVVTPGPNTAYTLYTSEAFSVASAGAHTLSIAGLVDTSTDRATFVDDISIQSVSAVPEPGTYALMALGLAALAGVAARRKRQA